MALAFGYVDHPPLSIMVLALWTAIAGDSLVALRLLPGLAGALTVFLAVGICRRMGGGAFAQVVTGLACTFCGYLAIHHYYSMNSWDLLLWALAFWLLMNALEVQSRRAWLLLGLVLGLGLLNKLSVLWLGAGLFAVLPAGESTVIPAGGLLVIPAAGIAGEPGSREHGLNNLRMFTGFSLARE